ncbi:MAG: hypothetical protein D5R97_08865 [Candidatus Syntrophonatronum acetioxidans]|uniref:Uncharacterized protein n=1 Tax=Candidatus Syntrophonatronum acetioxidans TaxID=1795816 RepID=A0A424YAV7_9FIRM|nr:MAG: hypothetical protein D5R97_08865 [Candidatus Syntrophonatronum acetioxidans]
MLGAYLVVLIISFPLLNVLPQEEIIARDRVGEDDLEIALQAERDFFSALEEGRLDQLEGVYKKGSWDFELEEEEEWLLIRNGEETHPSFNVVIDREGDPGRIQAFYYVTRTIFRQVDVTPELETPQVHLEGNRFIVKVPEWQELEVASFQREFVVGQFYPGDPGVQERGQPAERVTSVKGGRIHGTGDISVFGEEALYLKVPEDIQIGDSGFPGRVRCIEDLSR